MVANVVDRKILVVDWGALRKSCVYIAKGIAITEHANRDVSLGGDNKYERKQMSQVEGTPMITAIRSYR